MTRLPIFTNKQNHMSIRCLSNMVLSFYGKCSGIPTQYHDRFDPAANIFLAYGNLICFNDPITPVSVSLLLYSWSELQIYNPPPQSENYSTVHIRGQYSRLFNIARNHRGNSNFIINEHCDVSKLTNVVRFQ